MALTGLQIQKLLPKTNCKERGFEHCLAFAMKLGGAVASWRVLMLRRAKKIWCRFRVKAIAPGAAKAESKLAIRSYCHEKAFVNQTALAVNVNDTHAPGTIESTSPGNQGLFVGVRGQELRNRRGRNPERQGHRGFCQLGRQGSGDDRQAAVVASETSRSDAAAAVKGSHSVICADGGSGQRVGSRGKHNQHGHHRADLDQLAALAEAIKQSGFNGSSSCNSKPIRWPSNFRPTPSLASPPCGDSFKPMGYPTSLHRDDTDPVESTTQAIVQNHQRRRNLRGGGLLHPARDVVAHDPAAKHLHRSAKTHPGGAEGLRHRRTDGADSPA